jgi:hypothetical protein
MPTRLRWNASKRLVRQCYLAQYIQAQEDVAKAILRAWMLVMYCFVSVVVAAEMRPRSRAAVVTAKMRELDLVASGVG